MIIYSIVPPDIIFSNFEETATDKMEVEYMGVKLEVVPISNNRFVISRIFSSSPKTYLDPKLQPGSIITGVDLENSK